MWLSAEKPRTVCNTRFIPRSCLFVEYSLWLSEVCSKLKYRPSSDNHDAYQGQLSRQNHVNLRLGCTNVIFKLSLIDQTGEFRPLKLAFKSISVGATGPKDFFSNINMVQNCFWLYRLQFGNRSLLSKQKASQHLGQQWRRAINRLINMYLFCKDLSKTPLARNTQRKPGCCIQFILNAARVVIGLFAIGFFIAITTEKAYIKQYATTSK